jgi:uncharacterized protein YacL
MWITFLIPKIEDGNNFGVSIQEDMINDIVAIENDAAKLCTEIPSYFTTRGFYIKKVNVIHKVNISWCTNSESYCFTMFVFPGQQ